MERMVDVGRAVADKAHAVQTKRRRRYAMNKHVWKLCTLSLSVLIIAAIIVSNLSTMIVEAADEPVVFTEVARSGIAWPL
jgi:hypothetical protein